MLKHNLLLIFKSRLTIIIFSILVVVTLGYTFLDIYFSFSKIGSIGKVFNGEYMITKPYAASSFSLFYEDFYSNNKKGLEIQGLIKIYW